MFLLTTLLNKVRDDFENLNADRAKLPNVEVVWEIPITADRITGLAVHRDEIYVACARQVFRLSFDCLDQVTPTEVMVDIGKYPWTNPNSPTGENDVPTDNTP